MRVKDAVAGRRSIRGFLDKPVDHAVIERVLGIAMRSPSGGNLQPWRLYCLAGAPLARLKRLMAERLDGGEGPDEPLYSIYPPKLGTPYRERRFATGEQMYGLIGIPREDKAARRRWFSRNFEFFGAPVGLFCYVDRQMGAPQWSDLGMFLQTVMLLLHEEGLASCAQEAWSLYHRTVARVVEPADGLMLFCGMAIGHPDSSQPVNALRTERAPLAEVADFLGWDDPQN